MLKRILSLILIVVSMFVSVPVNADDFSNDIGVVVDKLAELTSDDRKNLMRIIYPLISIDGGIDILVSMVDNHKSAEDSVVDGYIAKMLEYTSKDELKFSLKSIKIVPKEIRKAYLQDFMNRVELPLSDKSNEKMDLFMGVSYEKLPQLENIMVEDGITNGVIAKILTVVPEVNDGEPVFSVSGKYVFSPEHISDSLILKWDELCEGTEKNIDFTEVINSVTDYMNNNYSYYRRENVAELFSELGICKIISVDKIVLKNASIVGESKVTLPVLSAYFDNGNMLFKIDVVTINIPKLNFADIEGWYESAITELAYMGIVSGRGDGKFYPNDYVKREEFVKMICEAVNIPETDIQLSFEDVDTNTWYYKYIRSAYNYKIINGQSADRFGIGENISRQDAAVICNNILKDLGVSGNNNIVFKDLNDVSTYAIDSVANLSSYGIINGDENGFFNPKNSITRAESAKIINEMIYLIANTK